MLPVKTGVTLPAPRTPNSTTSTPKKERRFFVLNSVFFLRFAVGHTLMARQRRRHRPEVLLYLGFILSVFPPGERLAPKMMVEQRFACAGRSFYGRGCSTVSSMLAVLNKSSVFLMIPRCLPPPPALHCLRPPPALHVRRGGRLTLLPLFLVCLTLQGYMPSTWEPRGALSGLPRLGRTVRLAPFRPQ